MRQNISLVFPLQPFVEVALGKILCFDRTGSPPHTTTILQIILANLGPVILIINRLPVKLHLQPITAEGLQGLSCRQPAEKVACSSTWSYKLLTHICTAVDGFEKMNSAWLTEAHGPGMSPVGISLGLTLPADAFLQTCKAGQQPSACWPRVIQKASISPLVGYVFCLCKIAVGPRNTKHRNVRSC